MMFRSRSLVSLARRSNSSSILGSHVRTVSALSNTNAAVQLRSSSIPSVASTRPFAGLRQLSSASNKSDMMEKQMLSHNVVEEGDQVTAHIYIKVKGGDVIVDTRKEEQPTTFMAGMGELIPGLEERVVGMKVGGKWEGMLAPEESFGLPVEDRVYQIPRSQHPDDVITVGQNVQLSDDSVGKVLTVTDEFITVDANHPLAGMDCEFHFEIISVDKEVEQAWSGVRVKTIEQGDGATFPQQGDVVEVSYEGTLAKDGKMFDASKKPLKFTLGIGQVIKGWDIGISKMSVGERAKLFIPSDFGYGQKGAGGVIPPNANLIFTVKLENIESRQ